MRTRSLIEQAKGMLAERLGCDPESAFGILSTRSQETNVPLVRIAADIVAAAPSLEPVAVEEPHHPEPSQAEPGLRRSGAEATLPEPETKRSIGLAENRQAPELRAVTGLRRGRMTKPLSMTASRNLRLAIAAMSAASDTDELVSAIVTVGLKEYQGAAAALFVAEPDGALRMLGCHGWPAQAVSDWHRVPSAVNTTVAQAVRTGAPVLLDGFTEHEFVLIGPGQSRVVFPIATGDRIVGALQFGWPVGRRFGEAMRLYLAHLAEAAGRAVSQIWTAAVAGEAAATTGDLTWIQTVLDGMHCQAHLLSPLRDRDGSVIDFVVEAVSGVSDAVTHTGVGRRLLDAHPQLATNGVFASYVEVLAHGGPWQRPPASEEVVANGRKRRILVSRRASRVGGAVLASWDRLDEVIGKEQHLARLEALGGFGWAEWDLNTGEGRWSAGMYRLLGRDPSREPPPFESLTDLVEPSDRKRVEQFVAEVIAGRDSVADARVRNNESKWVRFFCEARPANVPYETIYLLAQDISDRYAREQHLRSLQSRAAAGRLRLASQQDLTARLVDLLYPKERFSLTLPGVRVAGRHFLPESEVPLRADFCDAAELPDGSVMMLVGDMFGAGMAAAATAVRLVRPVLALGMAETPLTRILEVINTDLRRDEDPSLASLIIARFDPLSGELRMASAGHLPPILLSRKAHPPRFGSAGVGPALGLMEHAEYSEVTTHLGPDEAIVFYTDGVIDRHRPEPLEHLAEALDRGFKKGGAATLPDLPVPKGSDEACLAVLAVED
jgi:hypothetical protein